ncbi:MAG: type VI secretion system tip protein VgrG [Myxococcales bacterium]|nr:type VI secretion system tip protein VgrG [Myxococcales bacterium]
MTQAPVTPVSTPSAKAAVKARAPAAVAAAVSAVLGGPKNLELRLEGGEHALEVKRFSVTERLSEPFEVVLSCTSPEESLDLDGIVGRGAGFVTRGPTTRVWTGICREVTQERALDAKTGLSSYELVVVPDFWLLRQRRGHRIYQHLSAVDIVEKVLKEWHITPEVRLERGDFPKLEYRVQYGESDFDFVSRTLEEAGITYWFEDKASGETHVTVLVLCDKPEQQKSLGPILYVDNPNDSPGQDYVTRLRWSNGLRTGRTTLCDYDFRRPDFKLFGSGEWEKPPEDFYERYGYVPGGSVVELDQVSDKKKVADDRSQARHDGDALKARAQRQLEAARRDKRVLELESSVLGLRPGVVFAVDHHAHDELASDKSLLVVESLFHGTAVDEWMVTADAVSAEQRYRPEVRTPKPRIDGPQSAMVVGPAGQQIHTDEYGRVRVRFHWDREGAFDDSATCWLRVSQAWAGTGFGVTFVPRVGHEVLVEFLDGDPDQPVVVGRLYNAVARPPYVLPKHKTRATWKTDSSPHADGAFNEIMFEDKAGGELLFVQAQKNLQKLVKRHETNRTGKDRTQVVGETRVTVVGKLDAAFTGKQRLVKMVTPKKLKILEMGDPDVTPEKTWFEVVDEKITLTTGKASIVLEGDSIAITADGGIRLSSDGELVLQGDKVYFNCMPGKASSPDVDKLVADRVMRPGGRVMASVLRLFHKPPKGGDFDHEALKVVLAALPPPPANAGAAAAPAAAAATQLAKAKKLVDAAGSGDASDAALVATELAKLPPSVLDDLAKKGVRVKACRGSITDAMTNLKGVQPRGWPPGATFDQVPGIYDPATNSVVVATTGHGTPAGAHVPATGEGHGSANLVLHEAMHAVDLAGPTKISTTNAAFQAARTADVGALGAYFTQPGEAGLQETLAESAAQFYGGDPTMAQKTPHLAQFWQSDPFKSGQ